MGIKLPKTRCNGTMTESQYWSFIRSGLRNKSRRWAPIYTTLNKAKRPSKSKNKRLKFEYQCNECKKWKPNSEVAVDHIKPAGSLTCGAHLEEFVNTLFCEMDNLQVLCKDCHKIKTEQEKEDRKKND